MLSVDEGAVNRMYTKAVESNSVTNKGLTRVKRGSLGSEVLNSIRDAIFSGKFQPGEQLKEIVIARDLGVSQATVREALVQLENLGVVVRVPNAGSTVTRLSVEELKERVNLRVLLEGVAGCEAAQRMLTPDFDELETRLRDIVERVDENDYFGAAQADLRFHRYIWEKSGNRTLFRILDQLTAPLFAFVSILRSANFDPLRDPTSAHAPIISALRSRDEATIERAFKAAIEEGYGPYLSGPVNQQARALGFISGPGK